MRALLAWRFEVLMMANSIPSTVAEQIPRRHLTVRVGVEDLFSGEVRTCEVDVDIASAVVAMNDALKRAGCRMRSVQSCQGYEIEPGMVVGYIAFGSPAESGNVAEESQRAHRVLAEAALAVIEASKGAFDIEVAGMFGTGPLNDESGRLSTTLTVFLTKTLEGDPEESMRAIWSRLATFLARFR